VEQAKLTALREAGAAATDQQRAQIGALVEQIHAEQAQVEFITGLYDQLGQVGMTAVRGIADALKDGKIEAEELDDILQNLLGSLMEMGIQMIFKGLFGGMGGGAGLLGGLLGFSSGTANTGGQRGQVRGVVHGQEAVIPLPDGGKVPVEIAAPAPAAGAQKIEFKLINESGTPMEVKSHETSREGGVDIVTIVAGAMGQAAMGGKLGAFESVYGLRKRGA